MIKHCICLCYGKGGKYKEMIPAKAWYPARDFVTESLGESIPANWEYHKVRLGSGHLKMNCAAGVGNLSMDFTANTACHMKHVNIIHCPRSISEVCPFSLD